MRPSFAQRVIDPTPLWSVDIGPAAGAPAPVGSVENCRGFVVARGDGSVVRIGREGRIQATMRMDLPTDTGAVVADLHADGSQEVVASDCQGSVYAFSLEGRRLWKYTQATKSRDFRQLVVARLDSGIRPCILLSDSRGTVTCLDAAGRLKLSVKAARYRVSAPAIMARPNERPGIVYGTDAGDVDCLDPQGRLLWSTHLGAACGRSLPVLMPGGQSMVLLSRSFVDAHPAVCALDAATGRQLWTAPCASQSYQSIAFAPMTPGAPPSILFGDKNSLVYCVDTGGHLQWKTQLEARGIYFAPAIAKLSSVGPATIFVTVRTESAANPALYTLDGTGKILDALPLPGGGGSAPLLCRFAGERPLRLTVVSGTRLTLFRLQQAEDSHLLWPGASQKIPQDETHPVNPSSFQDRVYPLVWHRPDAPLHYPLEQYSTAALRTRGPDGVTHVLMMHNRTSFFQAAVIQGAIRRAEMGDNLLELRVAGAGGASRSVVIMRYRAAGAKRAAVERIQQTRLRMAGSGLAPLFGVIDARLNSLADDRLWTGATGPALERVDSECNTVDALLHALKLAHPAGPLMICKLANPWDNHQPSEMLSAAAPGSFVAAMPGNAYQSEAISVTNLTGRTLQLQAEMAAPAGVPPGALVLHNCVHITPEATGMPLEDPLPEIAPGTSILVEPGEPREIWLTLCSKGLPPGRHTLTLRLGDPASDTAPVDVPITLDVLPISLPERSAFRHINWLYLASISDPELREKTLRDALAHGTNVFNIPACTVQVDAEGRITGSESAMHDSLVQRLLGHAEMLVDGSVNLSWPAGFTPSSEVSDQAYGNALRWYDQHMRALGCSYADYALYLADEPGLTGDNSAFKRYVAAVRKVKAADPNLRIFCNPAGGATEEMLAPIAPLIDIWCPDMHLVKMRPASLQKLFANHGEYWHYEAPGDQRSIDPLGFYRMQPWVAFRYGMSGAGYWVYSSTSGWFEDPQRSTEYGAVYPAPQGPVTSKRWEATREGIQDYELLRMLSAEARNHPGPRGQQAIELLNAAVTDVTRGQEHVTDISRQASPLKPDYTAWMRWRSEILQELIALKQ